MSTSLPPTLFSNCLRACVDDAVLLPWLQTVPTVLTTWWHKRDKIYQQRIHRLLALPTPASELHCDDTVRLVLPTADTALNARIAAQCRMLIPWRKGPFAINDLPIDSEWRSSLKWHRLLPHLGAVAGQRILDVGAANGYFLWQLHAGGAAQCVGIDPNPLAFAQFTLFAHLYGQHKRAPWLLPCRLEDVTETTAFDTVLSLGVLYHHRAPLLHLAALAGQLRRNGQLFIETLALDGDEQRLLTPTGNYAGMANVWCIPSIALFTIWLQRSGFTAINVIDRSETGSEEQRATSWNNNSTHQTALNVNGNGYTIEGYPTAARVIVQATKGE